MNYRRLGKTGLDISVLGFGSSPFGNVYGTAAPDGIQAAVDVAIDLGVNFFDSSPYYGLTLAEERLGTALEGKRHQVVLATKCGRNGVDQFDFSGESIRRSVEASLRRLKTDYVDLLQAHDVEFGSEAQIIEETMPTLLALKEEGKARFIGITAYPIGMLRRIAEAVPVDTILSYCRYSLLNTDMKDALAPLGGERGIGLINASPLMMGVLTERGAPPWHSASPELKLAGQRAVAAAHSRGAEITSLALQFALAQDFAASTLIGMASPDEVRRNVDASLRPLDPALLAGVQTAIGNGFKTSWASGRPENAD